MTENYVIHLAREAIMMVLILIGPPLIASLVTGLIISVLQATTQIQEQTLTFVPKIIITFLVILIFSSWMLKTMVSFATNLISNLPSLIH